MNRRQAIGWGAAAAIAIPTGWLWWKKSDFDEVSAWGKKEENVLSAAVDALLPEGNMPGGIELGVDKFVSKMIHDCLPIEEKQAFAKELLVLAKKDFSTQTPEDRLSLLKSYPEDSTFISLLRNLAIRGYTTSEYYMMQVQGFEFIPGHYSGCVNLNQNA
ncbi:hypothetical protein Lbys_2705 [Leadbetterella byssophila DSM 17132]|uniref:Gluconate 2-dehydrogenase subunit 3 family protein n=1 Tax=Leadbetterella byssophila (strain DSM 17132 / JCM 16389 / KACC 11308 / NBRC 106382 / 4M15) TaxID=649349 RepID=E4RQF9_LEAB4|nr:gluconate 2-dehydrogenase subunit 3 family protein [Leadbetterella byssophila]ADQ18367.1 hypothetical protein Lbys_2705 [Leadbetterella byssophila DSM 17132]